MSPLAIDLFCGLGGWTEGLLAEGYRVIGFDNERHRYPARAFALPEESGKGMAGKNQNGTTLIGAAREQVHGYHTAPLTGGWMEYPAQLVIQDVLTLHGSQFKDAALIVASPPCQAYSYRAMPWKKAKALPPPDNTLFEACFRIQREAIEAAGHHIPLVVENVCGAQKWVGRARWHFGSFYLWGDVPALMPMTKRAVLKLGVAHRANGETNFHGSASRATKNDGGSWFNVAHNTTSGKGQNPVKGIKGIPHRPTGHWTNPEENGTKQGNDWFGSGGDCSLQRRAGSKSSARKAASAHIAKIPLTLARHIAAAWKS